MYQVCKLIMIKGSMKYRLESCTIYFAFLKKVTKPLTNKICRMILLYINIPIQIAGYKKKFNLFHDLQSKKCKVFRKVFIRVLWLIGNEKS